MSVKYLTVLSVIPKVSDQVNHFITFKLILYKKRRNHLILTSTQIGFLNLSCVMFIEFQQHCSLFNQNFFVQNPDFKFEVHPLPISTTPATIP